METINRRQRTESQLYFLGPWIKFYSQSLWLNCFVSSRYTKHSTTHNNSNQVLVEAHVGVEINCWFLGFWCTLRDKDTPSQSPPWKAVTTGPWCLFSTQNSSPQALLRIGVSPSSMLLDQTEYLLRHSAVSRDQEPQCGPPPWCDFPRKIYTTVSIPEGLWDPPFQNSRSGHRDSEGTAVAFLQKREGNLEFCFGIWQVQNRHGKPSLPRLT